MHQPQTINRTALFLAALISVLLVIGLHQGCVGGWSWSACVPAGLSLLPIAGGGEFLLVEAFSLTICLVGITFCFLAYCDPHQPGRRAAIVFTLLLLATYLGELNLFRDDVRAPVLALLLVWVSIELLLLRRLLPIVLLFVGCMIAFAGSLGDHTMHIQFENTTGESISQSVLAPVQRIVGPFEETTELVGWTLFLFAAIATFKVQVDGRRASLFLALALLAIVCISFGDTYMMLRQTHVLQGFRKTGLFTAFIGVALATAALYQRLPRSTPEASTLARAHAATFATAAFMTVVLAPIIYTHEHNKTVSYATWLLPLLSLYFYLLRLRPAKTGAKNITGPETSPAPEH